MQTIKNDQTDQKKQETLTAKTKEVCNNFEKGIEQMLALADKGENKEVDYIGFTKTMLVGEVFRSMKHWMDSFIKSQQEITKDESTK